MTIEDPVEYQLPGIEQVQVSPSIGLIFARGASLGDFELLQPAVYVLAALSLLTVAQRVWHVRRELSV